MYRAARPYWPHSQAQPPAEPEQPDPCPGRCNSAYRAAEQRRTDKGVEHDLEPWPGEPVWCPPCATAIRGALADWPALARALQDEIDAGATAALTECVSGSKNRPIHDHEAESLLLDEFSEWVGSWEDTIRAQRALNPRDTTDLHRNPLRIITAAAAVLPAHLDWHLSQRPEEEWDLARDFGLDLLAYHRRAQALTATAEPEPERIIGVPCPRCGYKALAWEVEDSPSRRQAVRRHIVGGDGEPLTVHRPLGPGAQSKATETVQVLAKGSVTGYVKCRRCKPAFHMTPDEYRQWTQMSAADPAVRAAFTAELLAEVFGGTVPPQYAKIVT